MLGLINALTMSKSNPENSVYLFIADVTEESCKDCMQWILSHNFTAEDEEYAKPEALTIMISSKGGDLYSCLALIDIMRGSSIPIQTIGIGQIASAGLLIFMAGQKGMRVMSENAFCMSHSFSSGSFGNKHELFAIQKHYSDVHKKMVQVYKKYTELDEAVIEAKLLPPTDVWLSPEDMKQLNICDHIASLK